jgi:hypothetical protein
MTDGHGFVSKSAALPAARSCLEEFPETEPILSTATSWLRDVEKRTAGARLLGTGGDLRCEAATASAAWDTIRGVGMIGRGEMENLVIPCWGLTRQFSALRLSIQ